MHTRFAIIKFGPKSCYVIRDLKQTTTATRMPPIQRHSEQNNDCTCTLQIVVHVLAVFCAF